MARITSNWYYLLIVLLLSTSIIVALGDVKPVNATACTFNSRCFLGRDVEVPGTWGSQASINSPGNNFVLPANTFSFLFVQSYAYYNGIQHFMQSGWTYSNNAATVCPIGHPYAYTEWTNDDISYHGVCITTAPITGRNNYYNQDNGSAYWCNGFNGSACLSGPITESTLGFSSQNHLVVYGEVNDSSATMGGVGIAGQADAEPITDKLSQNSSSISNPLPNTGSLYPTALGQPTQNGNCGSGAGNCPYTENFGFSGNPSTLYVQIHT